MSYGYEAEKPRLFTDEGQRGFLKVRDHARAMISHSGAATLFALMRAKAPECADSFAMIACIDRLVELGELRLVYKSGASQFDVYVAGEKWQ